MPMRTMAALTSTGYANEIGLIRGVGGGLKPQQYARTALIRLIPSRMGAEEPRYCKLRCADYDPPSIWSLR